MITVGSLFSGIGGMDYAFREAGFHIAFQVEIDDFCRQVLAKHFPDTVRHADIYDCHDLPHVDVLTAGFPCQPFSVAGLQQGSKDERFLVPEMLRVIREVKPNVVLLENVPGFTSLNDGFEFKQLLRALAEMGFDAEWGHIRASDAGAPHRRERWFCVAYAQSCDDERISRAMGYAPQVARKKDDGAVVGGESQNGKLAYPSSSGRQERRVTALASRKGLTTGRNSTSMGNAKRSRRHANRLRRSIPQSTNRYARHGRQLIASVGRDVDGIPAKLDRHQFPAPPGQPQHAAEPPRVTTHAQDRAKRLKALGNAVVPQVIYPIALAIREWFEAQAIEGSAA